MDTMLPLRIVRKREKGWRMPPNTKYVGRPTRWGNPFETAVEFEDWLDGRMDRPDLEDQRQWILEHIEDLRGVQLCCWCPMVHDYLGRLKCHAEVLIERANCPPRTLKFLRALERMRAEEQKEVRKYEQIIDEQNKE